jgi:hypothetical protein
VLLLRGRFVLPFNRVLHGHIPSSSRLANEGLSSVERISDARRCPLFGLKVIMIRQSLYAALRPIQESDSSKSPVFSVLRSRRLGFASPHIKGRQPYWPGTRWRYYGNPALQRAKVTKQVSYHTFRHTFGTLLNANGENPTVVQELLRHASLKVTTDVYMQAVGPQKREAEGNLVRLARKGAVLEIKPKWIKLDHEEKRRFRGSSLFC